MDNNLSLKRISWRTACACWIWAVVKITVLPEEKGRTLRSPDWSPDGKWIAVVSAAVKKEGYYQLEAMEIVLLEVGSWQRRRIAVDRRLQVFPVLFSGWQDGLLLQGQDSSERANPCK